jgi:glycyl-tRNA synthetase beta chain
MGFTVQEVDSVVSQRPGELALVPARLEAVRTFAALPESESLAAANKRIGNILRKAGAIQPAAFDPALLSDDAERALAAQVDTLAPLVERAIAQRDFSGALSALAGARTAVDRFFDDVMVMVDDERLRANRLALLARLHAMMNRVADISKLSSA